MQPVFEDVKLALDWPIDRCSKGNCGFHPKYCEQHKLVFIYNPDALPQLFLKFSFPHLRIYSVEPGGLTQ